jgi:hypothetical protein
VITYQFENDPEVSSDLPNNEEGVGRVSAGGGSN